MRLSGLSLATILLFSSAVFAQHSGGGGGGSSSASSSGGSSNGGGSHGGGSSYSGGGGHSSGGSSGGHSVGGGSHSTGGSHTYSGGSHGGFTGSGGHRSDGGSSTSLASTRSGARGPVAVPGGAIREPKGAVQIRTMPARRTFFSFVRHPFRKPAPKTMIVIRPPICGKGPCRPCPPGQAHSGGGCVAGTVPAYTRNICPHLENWNSGSCLFQTQFIDSCSGLRALMEEQAQRTQAMQLEQQSACSRGQSQACSEATVRSQSEEARYESARERYRQCIANNLSAYSWGRRALLTSPAGLSFDPLRFELEY